MIADEYLGLERLPGGGRNGLHRPVGGEELPVTMNVLHPKPADLLHLVDHRESSLLGAKVKPAGEGLT